MQEKPTRWAYISTTILLILFGFWTYDDYQESPDRVPWEPLIAVISSLFVLGGFLLWKRQSKANKASPSDQDQRESIEKKKSETEHHITEEPTSKGNIPETNITQEADKIYNIGKIGKADFS